MDAPAARRGPPAATIQHFDSAAPSAVGRLLLRGRSYTGAVSAITMVALGIRLAFIGRLPLWRDEAFTGIVQRRSIAGMLDAVRHDSAPPLSYMLGRSVATFSTSPWALRVVPALAGCAAVPIGAALARRIAGDRAGIIAAATVAVMPVFVLSSLDARMYALAGMLVMASVLTVWRATDRPSAGRLACHGAVCCLAMYTHYLAAFAVVAELIAVALVLRPPGRVLAKLAGVALLAGLALVPWLLAASAQFQHEGDTFWLRRIDPGVAADLWRQFLGGPEVGGSSVIIRRLSIGTGAAALAVLVISLPWVARAVRRNVTFVTACVLGAIALLFVASLRRPLIDARYASVLWGPLAALLGVGVAQLRPRVAAALAVAVMAAASVTLELNVAHPAYPEVAGQLDRSVTTRDDVVTNSPDYLLLLYYGGARTNSQLHIIVRGKAPWYWGVAAWPAGGMLHEVPASHDRIFAVVEPSDSPLRMPAGYTQRDSTCLRGVCVNTWERA